MIEKQVKCCDYCGKPPLSKPLLKCSRCKQAYYHDATCQKKHYKIHKEACRRHQEVLSNGGETTKGPNVHGGEDASGIQVIDSPCKQLGRVAISTRQVQPGECVFADRPSVIFDTSNGFFGLWDAFLEADKATQERILDLQQEEHYDTKESSSNIGTEDTESPRQQLVTKELDRYYDTSQELRTQLPEALARKLVRIVDLNAHAYKPAGGTNGHADKTALYVMGSMPEHSCCPNMTSHTDSLGVMEFMSEDFISKSDRVSWSYIPRVLEQCRKDRQLQLLTKKHFDCLCRRCLGPDECNPLNCAKCSTRKIRPLFGSLFQFRDHEAAIAADASVREDPGGENRKHKVPKYVWKCVSCGWLGREEENCGSIHEQLKQIDSLARQIETMQQKMQNSGQIDPMSLVQCFVLQGQVAKTCHPMHWLHPAVWSMIVSVNSAVISMAFRSSKTKGTDANLVSSLQLSAICQLKRAIWIRRVNSILHGRRGLDRQQDDISSFLKHAVQEIADTDSQECQLTPKPDPSLIPSLIQELLVVMNKKKSETSSDSVVDHSSMAPMVYYAGLDLLLASRGSANERIQQKIVAKLFSDFRPLLHRWKTLTSKQREEVETFLQSGGTINSFQNHYS